MLGIIEKQALENINFPERFIKARNEFHYKPEEAFKLTKKEVLEHLMQQGLPFIAKPANVFYADVQKSEYTFRLLFDINKDLIPLTYIYLLVNNEFIKNGLGNLGSSLKYFDLNGYRIIENFGLNNILEFNDYIRQMKSIYLDFIEEYMKLLETEKH